MQTIDLAWQQLLWLLVLVLIPWLWLGGLGLRMSREIGLGMLRMILQLGLIGIYLKTLFDLNDPWLNGIWVLVMLVVAALTILRRAGLRRRIFFATSFAAVSASVLFTTSYLLVLVIQPPHYYDARYLVPLAGMILGNCLHGNIIGLERFFSVLRQREQEYQTYLMLGATRREALQPFLREAVKAAINPTVGGMATMGLVSLPGMMTGQILGGADPWVAVKYQIAIMLCIFTSTALAALLNIRLSMQLAFNDYDGLRDDILA